MKLMRLRGHNYSKESGMVHPESNHLINLDLIMRVDLDSKEGEDVGGTPYTGYLVYFIGETQPTFIMSETSLSLIMTTFS